NPVPGFEDSRGGESSGTLGTTQGETPAQAPLQNDATASGRTRADEQRAARLSSSGSKQGRLAAQGRTTPRQKTEKMASPQWQLRPRRGSAPPVDTAGSAASDGPGRNRDVPACELPALLS